MNTFGDKKPTPALKEFRKALMTFWKEWNAEIAIEDIVAVSAYAMGNLILYVPHDVVPDEHMQAFILENMKAGSQHGLTAKKRAAGRVQ